MTCYRFTFWSELSLCSQAVMILKAFIIIKEKKNIIKTSRLMITALIG